jgi:hypothetical protein
MIFEHFEVKQLIFCSFIFLSGCALFQSQPQPQEDLITLQTTKDVARSTYLYACVKNRKEFAPQEKHFPLCLEQARQYMQNNIEDILSQDGKGLE